MKFLLGLFLLLLAACSDSESSAPSSSGKDLEGFILMPAPKDGVILGTDSEKAQPMDRPQMKVMLNYDFHIAQHEVTCQDFADYPDVLPNLSCEGNHVITGITYYDAVLLSNAKSKAEKRDTVYSYSKIIRDKEGYCINLTGLRFNPDVEGYRLPTEAEWVYAFSVHYDSKQINEDFTFFAKEWVNDWLGRFRDTTVTNYVGAPNGGSFDEHVVKGGNFSAGTPVIDLYSRGDIYVVSASSRAQYIGFRLAIGKIPSAVWLDNDGVAVHNSQSILLTQPEVRAATGSYQVKLVYRDNVSENLVYVDFNNGKPTLVEVDDSLNNFHPDISPDGQWVVFSTGMEGVTGESQVFATRFGSSSVSVKLNVENAAIPRFRVTAEGDTVVVYVSDSGDNSAEGNFLAQSTWQVPFSKGVFGTPEKLFDGAYHGGVRRDNQFAVTGARLLRSRVGDKHLVWYDSAQACNVSLSQDGSNRTLFLDFGGKPGREFAGTKYGVHEQILIADSTGKLIQMIPAPEGYSFDHTEWVKGAHLIVASLTNPSGNHEKVVLINTADSSITDFVGGDDLYHPCMWIENGLGNLDIDDSLDPDSAGLYLGSKFLQEDIFWRYKMELLWKYRDSADVAVVGSSRAVDGVRPRIMDSSGFVLNLAQIPNSIFTTRDFVKNYVLPHLNKLKYLVVSLDIDFWWKGDDEGDNFFIQSYKEYPGFVYDENHNYWRDGYPQGLYELTNLAPGVANGSSQYLKEYGFTGQSCVDWGEEPPAIATDTTNAQDSILLERSFEALQEMVEFARQKDVIVIGAIFPQSPAYKNTGAYGRHGVRRSLAAHMIARLKSFESSNFVLLDENKMGEHDYSSNMFENYDHLCFGGAKRFSNRLDSLIASLE